MGKPIGSHWDDTSYTKLYQLYRRVETVARELEQRRQRKWQPLKIHIDELYDISLQLKVLDKKIKTADNR